MSHSSFRVTLKYILSLLVGVVLTANSAWAEDSVEKTPEQTPEQREQRVAELIDQLGVPKFADRQRAQGELRLMGLTAFDALRKAREHEDIEIATRARFLLNSMHVRWFEEGDPKIIRDMLNGFGQRSDADRQATIDHLAAFEHDVSLLPLCRLVRFEISMRLAKRAAINVMRMEVPSDPKLRQEYADQIEKLVSQSNRTTARWMQVYAETLLNPKQTVGKWQGLIQQEQQAFAQFPDESDVGIIRDLQRWHAELYWDLGQNEQAEDVVRELIKRSSGSREELMDLVPWMIGRNAWDVVDELAGRYAEEFKGDIYLQYLLAAAQLKRGLLPLARQTADSAFEKSENDAGERVQLAAFLQEHGLFPWAIRELEAIIKQEPVVSPSAFSARRTLAELYHDQKKDLEAAETLQFIEDEYNKDKTKVGEVFRALRTSIQSTLSRMYTFYAHHYGEKGDWKKTQEYIQRGIALNPRDVDLLIAMYRAKETDQNWKLAVTTNINNTATGYSQQVRQYEQLSTGVRSAEQQKQIHQAIATMCNQYAWLVANTEGDYQTALKFSQRSLELLPGEAGHLDTLGRCYYALKDYENAVRFQRRAVKLEPHSGQIVRQLELFEEALRRSQEEDKKQP